MGTLSAPPWTRATCKEHHFPILTLRSPRSLTWSDHCIVQIAPLQHIIVRALNNLRAGQHSMKEEGIVDSFEVVSTSHCSIV
jgi:hypothetical protein